MKNKNEFTIFSNDFSWQRVLVELSSMLFIELVLIYGGIYLFPSLGTTSEMKFYFSASVIGLCFLVVFTLFLIGVLNQTIYTHLFEGIMIVGAYTALDRFAPLGKNIPFDLASFGVSIFVLMIMITIYIGIYFGSLTIKNKFVKKN